MCAVAGCPTCNLQHLPEGFNPRCSHPVLDKSDSKRASRLARARIWLREVAPNIVGALIGAFVGSILGYLFSQYLNAQEQTDRQHRLIASLINTRVTVHGFRR